MSRYKQVDRENLMNENRQFLLNAAAAEFASQGYEKANINSISKAAGYAKGTIYNYFATKRALMLELIDEIATGHFEYIAEQVQKEDDPACRLECFIEAGFAWVTDNFTQAKVMITALNGADTEFKNHMYARYQPMFELVGREILVAGIQQGTFRPVDPTSTAGLLMTIYLGAASQIDEQGKPWLAPAQVVEFVLSALRLNKSPNKKEA